MALPEALQRRQKEMSGDATKSGKKPETKSKKSSVKPGVSQKPSAKTGNDGSTSGKSNKSKVSNTQESLSSTKEHSTSDVKQPQPSTASSSKKEKSVSKQSKAKHGKKSTSSSQTVTKSSSTKKGAVSTTVPKKSDSGKSKSKATKTGAKPKKAAKSKSKSQTASKSPKKQGKSSETRSTGQDQLSDNAQKVKDAQVALVGEEIAGEINSDDDLPEEFEKLTAKQRKFVVEFALNRNAADAARKSGYKGDDKTLAQVGYENLRKPDIQNAVRAYMQPHFERYAVTADAQVRELADIAHSPWRDHVTIRMTKDMKIEVKMQLSNKIAALIELNKMMGLYPKEDDGGELKPSINLHFHKHMTSDDARQALLDYLRKRG